MNGDAYSSRGSRQTSSRDHHGRDDRRDRGGDRDRPRRRSRSPGHRSSRRDYEVDTYSSSRDYREREREDRYSGGRDRRGGREDRGGGDREWDRDRNFGRRDNRRDDAPPRRERDRDLFDDRRGGGGRRDREPHQKRERSASPPRKPKEPTPDLTDTVPILEKKRRLTQWDIKPQGYDNVTAEQAKLSGMFPLPGAPRQQPMDPSKLQAFMDQPASSTTNAALKPSNSRQAKRIFVSNVPANATNETLQDFFNLQMNGLNVVQGRDPCVSAQLSDNKSYALLEFKTSEDATLAFALDGIEMEASQGNGANGAANGAGSGLQVKRPKDYIAPAKFDESESHGIVSNVVPDTQSKICITRIPEFIDDAQVQELLAAFGALKSFVLVKDTSSGQSRGVAFCEYVDVEGATETAVSSLNGMELGDRALKLVRACIGASQVGAEMSVGAMSILAGTESNDLEHSRVLCLLNMVVAEELLDNDDYEEICEDVKEECSKYGAILDMKVPRPAGGSRQSNGVGKIYIKYDTVESSTKALRALAGRKFADRTVVVTYFGEQYFDVNAW